MALSGWPSESWHLWMGFRVSEGAGYHPRLADRIEHQESYLHGAIAGGCPAEQWEPELIRILVQERHMMWIGPLLFGLFAAMGIFLIFDNPQRPWFGVLWPSHCLGIAIWYLISMPRRGHGSMHCLPSSRRKSCNMALTGEAP